MQTQKLSIPFLLNDFTEDRLPPFSAFLSQTQQQQQPQHPQHDDPMEEEEEEEGESPVHTLLALKNYILHHHQQQHNMAESAEVVAPVASDSATTTCVTTTRSSLVFVNTMEGLPLILPAFTRQESSHNLLNKKHNSTTQHNTTTQQQQSPLESLSLSGKKRKQPEGALAAAIANTTTTTTTLAYNTTQQPFTAVANAGMGRKTQDNHGNNNLLQLETSEIKDKNNKYEKKEKKRRIRPSKEQAAFLDEFFSRNKHPDTPARLKIAETINMKPKTVCTWFQNKRAREKRALRKQKKVVFHEVCNSSGNESS